MPVNASLVARLEGRALPANERQEALLAQVPALAARLRAKGATRVRLFGSLATLATPHAETDIDLCVEGLDERRVGEASLEFDALGAPVDLVRWEAASEPLRRIIETDGIEVPVDMKSGAEE